MLVYKGAGLGRFSCTVYVILVYSGICQDHRSVFSCRLADVLFIVLCMILYE